MFVFSAAKNFARASEENRVTSTRLHILNFGICDIFPCSENHFLRGVDPEEISEAKLPKISFSPGKDATTGRNSEGTISTRTYGR